MSSAQDFISKSDRAKLDKQMADKQVNDTTTQLTEDQKAQADANAAAADAKLALTAVVSTVPEGISTDDGRYFEVERGELREAVPIKASAVSGELTKDDSGNYVFKASTPSPSPEPEPAPDVPAPNPNPNPVPGPSPAPDQPQSGSGNTPLVDGGEKSDPAPEAGTVMSPKPQPKSGFVA